RGSLGLDLATSIDCTLIDNKPRHIPTGIRGPLIINGQAVGALLIGRSPSTLAGLTVAVGLIDADFTGEVQIMAYTLYPPLHVPAGSRIAQLIPLPQLAKDLAPNGSHRGEEGFGSTGGLALLTVDLKHRPKWQITVQYQEQAISLAALLDTGADVTIIA
ncbi:POK9 protein, partial [Ramphastos sulfuratus]|nr:POK9 protein [Ramphastos sulfuratus]